MHLKPSETYLKNLHPQYSMVATTAPIPFRSRVEDKTHYINGSIGQFAHSLGARNNEEHVEEEPE